MRKDENFIRVDHWIISKTGLKIPNDQKLFSFIYGWEGHRCYPSWNTMMKATGLKRQTLSDSLDRLQGIDPEIKKGRTRAKPVKFPKLIKKETKGRKCEYISLVEFKDGKLIWIDTAKEYHAEDIQAHPQSDEQTTPQSDEQITPQSDEQTTPQSVEQTQTSQTSRPNNTKDKNNNTTTAAVALYSSTMVHDAVRTVFGTSFLSNRVAEETARMLSAQVQNEPVNLEGYIAYVRECAIAKSTGNMTAYFSTIVKLPAYFLNFLSSEKKKAEASQQHIATQYVCPICGYTHNANDLACPKCKATRDICTGDARSIAQERAKWQLRTQDPQRADEYEQACQRIIESYSPTDLLRNPDTKNALWSAMNDLSLMYLGIPLESDIA